MNRLLLTSLTLLLAFCYCLVLADEAEKTEPAKTTSEATTETKAEPAQEPIDAGKVTKIVGSAEITRGEEKIAAALNTIVRVGDYIEVASAGMLEITLFNEPGEESKKETNPTVLTLSETAKLTIKSRKKEPSGDTTTELDLKEGKLDSKVDDGRKPGWQQRRDKANAAPGTSKKTSKSNYQVSTPTAVAGVRGTEFILAVTPTKTFIYVKSGSVWAKHLETGEIRTVKRNRLLEIGLSGFGLEIIAGETEANAMASSSFSRDFNPFTMASGASKPTETQNVDDETRRQNVDSSVKGSMGSVRETTGSSGTPDPVTPPSGPPTPGEPPIRDLPVPPPPPPAVPGA